jgi:hypothetical protein
MACPYPAKPIIDADPRGVNNEDLQRLVFVLQSTIMFVPILDERVKDC